MSKHHRSGKPENAPWPDDSPLPTDLAWPDQPTPEGPPGRSGSAVGPSASPGRPEQTRADRRLRVAGPPDAPSPEPAAAPANEPAPAPIPVQDTEPALAPVHEAEPETAADILPDPAARTRVARRSGVQPQSAPRPPRGRRNPQDLPDPAAVPPLAATPERGPWRAAPYVALAATLAWVGALTLLLLGPARVASLGLPPRVAIGSGWALAAVVCLLPLQLRLGLPGITLLGSLGYGLLGYLLAFAPAPTGWLLDLPDVPTYLLFFLALFFAVSATALPITFALGQRVYRLRVHRHDVGRARRQAYELALLTVAAFVMAGLRVLSPISLGLLALVVVLTEALLLSQVQPEG